MQSVLGTSIGVYIGVTVIVIGFAAYMTGQALGDTWKPWGQLLGYCLLLGFVSRFLIFALFDGVLLSLSGYLIDVAVLVAVSSFAYRLSRTARMVSQYPWLYERCGLLRWGEKGHNN